VLLQNHRLGDLTEVNKRFAQVLDERAGVVTAEVKTVHLVPEASQQALRAKLMTLTGKNVHLKFSTNEDLIGGIVTRIGSTIYDGSVRSQLQQVKQKMASGS
jgi:F-type H+-transporting ATPase subunit delta